MRKLLKIILKIFRVERKSKEGKRTLGHLPDPVDLRDHVMGVTKLGVIKADLTEYASDVKQQGRAQSCTAHAVILVHEMEQRINGKEVIEGSEQYNYYNSRKYGELFPNDSGAYLRDACKSLKNLGDCPEKLMPYNDNNVNYEPGIFCESFASWFKIKEYVRIISVQGIKQSIIEKHPVAFGVPVYSNILSCDGTIPLPEGNSIGGHAMAITGFDDEKENFTIQNSWGNEWGDEGRANLPYEYFNKIPWWDAWHIKI